MVTCPPCGGGNEAIWFFVHILKYNMDIYPYCQVESGFFSIKFFRNIDMNFYERIKSYVREKGVTIDVYIQTLFNGEKDKEAFYSWKKRKILPRANEALIIARDMGITIEELIGEPSPLGLNFDERELVKSYRLFDVDDKREIKTLIAAKLMKYAKKDSYQVTAMAG
jgi:hypothetical protein